MPVVRLPALTAIAVLLTAVAPGPAAALDETRCRLLHEALPAAFGLCAALVVPESYDDPDGPSLSLHFARIPALTATPEPDPLLLINGGPGGSAVDLYLQSRGAFDAIRRERDILLLDQRGTGRSASGLDCDLPDGFELATASQDTIRTTVDDCIGEFMHDPRFFTTSVAVQDLESLRRELDIDQWNIYGISYGTRVAQHYLRRFGERVRTMVLDGVVPADLALGPAIAADAQRALDAIFARCAQSPGCGDRFPSIDEQFAELRQRFDNDSIEVIVNDPVTGEPVSIVLDETHLQAFVRFMSYSDATVALIPLVLDEAYRGNYAPLAAQAQLQIRTVFDSIGFAMHNSVVCTEDAPFFDDEADDEADDDGNERDGEVDAYLGASVVEGLRAICESWPAGVIDDDFKTPVRSARPVLLLSGEHDPVTPPAYAEHVIDGGLTNARHIIGRAQGHGLAVVGCMPRLLADFVASAAVDGIDSGCLDDEPPMPFFLSFQGPMP